MFATNCVNVAKVEFLDLKLAFQLGPFKPGRPLSILSTLLDVFSFLCGMAGTEGKVAFFCQPLKQAIIKN